MDECNICYKNHADTILHPCKHTICSTCQAKIYQINKTCPFCRQHINALHPISHPIDCTLQVGNGFFAGVTISNTRDGVIVKRMHKNDEAYKYLKRGDVITHINGLPALNHAQVVDIINKNTNDDTAIHLRVLPLRQRSFLVRLCVS